MSREEEHLASMVCTIAPRDNTVHRKLFNMLWSFRNSHAGTLKANQLFFAKFEIAYKYHLEEKYGDSTYTILKNSDAFKRFSWSKLSTYPLQPNMRKADYWVALVKPFLNMEQTTDKTERDNLLLEAAGIILKYVDIPESYWSSYENWSMSMHLGSRTLGAWCQVIATSTVTAAATYCRYQNEEWQHYAPADVMDVAGDVLPIVIYVERTMRSRGINDYAPLIERCLLFSSLWMAMRSKFLLYAVTRPFVSSQLLLGTTLQRRGWEEQVLWSFIPERNRDFLDLGFIVGTVDIIFSSMIFWGFCTQYVYSLGIPMVSWVLHSCYVDANRKLCDPNFWTGDLIESYHNQAERLKNDSFLCRNQKFLNSTLQSLNHVIQMEYSCDVNPNEHNNRMAENIIFNLTMCHSDSMLVGPNVLSSMLNYVVKFILDHTGSMVSSHMDLQLGEYFYWFSSTTMLYMENRRARQCTEAYENIVGDVKILHNSYGGIMRNWSTMNKTMKSIQPSIEFVIKQSFYSQNQDRELPGIYDVTEEEAQKYGSIQRRNQLDERLSTLVHSKRGIRSPLSRPTLVYYIQSLPWPASECVNTRKCMENAEYFVKLVSETPVFALILSHNVLQLLRLTPSAFPPQFKQDTKVAERILLGLYAGLNPVLWNTAVVPYMNDVLLKGYKDQIQTSTHEGHDWEIHNANIFWDKSKNYRKALELIFDFLPYVHIIAPTVANTCMKTWLQAGIENTIVLVWMEKTCAHIRMSPTHLPGRAFQSHLGNVMWLETGMVRYIMEKQIQTLSNFHFMRTQKNHRWIQTKEDVLMPILFTLQIMPDFFSRPNIYWKRFFMEAKSSNPMGSAMDWWRLGLRALLNDRWVVDRVGSTYLSLLANQLVLDAFNENSAIQEGEMEDFWLLMTNVEERVLIDRYIQVLLPWYGPIEENILLKVFAMAEIEGVESIPLQIYEANKSCFLSSLIYILLTSDVHMDSLETWLNLAYHSLLQRRSKTTQAMDDIMHDIEDAIDFTLLFIRTKFMKHCSQHLSPNLERMKHIFSEKLQYIQNFTVSGGYAPFKELAPFFW